MSTFYDDNITFKGAAKFAGAIDMSSATVTGPAGQGVVKFAEQPFDYTDFFDSPTKSLDSLPQNVILLAAHVVMTTALAFSAGTTTGVSVKIGNAGDDDGFGTSTALAGSAGYRRPAPGVLAGGVIAGGSGGVIATFTATGGTPNLLQVSAGAGKIVVTYIEV